MLPECAVVEKIVSVQQGVLVLGAAIYVGGVERSESQTQILRHVTSPVLAPLNLEGLDEEVSHFFPVGEKFRVQEVDPGQSLLISQIQEVRLVYKLLRNMGEYPFYQVSVRIDHDQRAHGRVERPASQPVDYVVLH